MQSILRNPLASPYTLDISSAASFGAALAIIFKTSFVSLLHLPYEYVVVVNAFFFSLVSTAAVYGLTRMQRVTAETIVLLGIAMMFMFQAFTSLVQYLGDPDRIAELTYWMFGSLNSSTWTTLGIVSVVAIIGSVIAYRWVWDLNALVADDESASTTGVTFSYRQKPVLDSVDVSAHYGEVVCIIGANGAGKTTLLRCLAGLLQPQAGTVTIADRSLRRAHRNDLSKLQAFVPQSAASSLPMTVFDAVLLGRRPYLGWYPISHDLNIAAAAIDRLGLGPLAMRNLNQLSGGERQKVAIARAVTQQAQILLLDEPTTYLDLKYQLTVLDIISALAAEDTSIITTMHDLNLALRVADRIVSLSDGHVIADQSPAAVTPAVIEKVYGVQCEISTAAQQRIIVPLRANNA